MVFLTTVRSFEDLFPRTAQTVAEEILSVIPNTSAYTSIRDFFEKMAATQLGLNIEQISFQEKLWVRMDVYFRDLIDERISMHAWAKKARDIYDKRKPNP